MHGRRPQPACTVVHSRCWSTVPNTNTWCRVQRTSVSAKHRDFRTVSTLSEKYPEVAEAERPFSNPRGADTVTKRELVAAEGNRALEPRPTQEPSDDSTIGPDGLMQGNP